MKPARAWGIGLYVDGNLAGLMRWASLRDKPLDPMIAHSRDEARKYLHDLGYPLPEGVVAKPVRVTITAEEE